jgi:hypothetical protein
MSLNKQNAFLPAWLISRVIAMANILHFYVAFAWCIVHHGGRLNGASC